MFIELRSCALVALSQETIKDFHLFLLKNKEYYQQTISSLEIELNVDSFQKQIERFFQNDRVIQVLVYRYGAIVGTTFLYWSQDGIRISNFFDKRVHSSYIPFEAVFSTIDFGVKEYGIEDLFFSVYEDNDKMLSIVKKINADLISVNPSEVNLTRKVHTYKLEAFELKRWLQKYHNFINR